MYPAYPALQLQVYRLMPSTQDPPFWQGFDAHSSMSIRKKIILQNKTLFLIVYEISIMDLRPTNKIACFATVSCIPWHTITRKWVYAIIASTTILTWAWHAIINICFTIVSCKSEIAIASIRVDTVNTSSSILARIWSTFIYVCKKNFKVGNKFWVLWNVNI